MGKICLVLKKRGFAAMELLIVLAVAGLMFFASLRAGDSYNRLALKQETHRFAASLESYILLAVQKETDLKIIFSVSGYELTAVEEEKQRILQAVSFPRFLNIKPVTSEEKEINLYQSKVVTPVSFRVSRKDASCTVVLSLRGRVRTEC